MPVDIPNLTFPADTKYWPEIPDTILTISADLGGSTRCKVLRIPDTEAHDRGVASEYLICRFDARLINPIIGLLFIAAGNTFVVQESVRIAWLSIVS